MKRTIFFKAMCWLALLIAPRLVTRWNASTELAGARNGSNAVPQHGPARGLLYVIEKSLDDGAVVDRVTKPSCQGHAYENVPITAQSFS